MKTYRARNDLILTLGTLLVIVCFAIIIFSPVIFLHVFYLHWLLLLFCLFLILSPIGKKTIDLSTSKQRHRNSTLRAALQVWAFQGCLLLIFFSICELVGNLLPINTTTHAHLFHQTEEMMLWKYGLFPWAGICLVALGMAFISYHFKEDAFMHRILTPIYKSGPYELFGLNVNIDTRMATFFAFSATLALMSLITAVLLAQITVPIATGLHLTTLFIVMILVLFAFTKPFSKLTNLLFKRQLPIIFSVIFLTILLAFIILLLSWLFFSFNQKTIATPWLLKIIQRAGWMNLWNIFALAWWIGWIPLSAIFLARTLKAQSIRSLLFVGLILPLLLSAFFLLNHTIEQHLLWHQPILISFLGIFAFIGLLILITEKSPVQSLTLSILEKPGPIKIRAHHFYFRKSFQMALAIIYLFLPGGIPVLSILALIMTLPFFLILFLTAISIGIWFKKERV